MMEAMVIGHSVPIYQRTRPQQAKKSATAKVRPKRKTFRRKPSFQTSDTEWESDAVLDSPQGQTALVHDPRKLVRESSVAETASTISLPYAPPSQPLPPTPDLPKHVQQQENNTFRLQSLAFPRPRASQVQFAEELSARHSPLTDLVAALNSPSISESPNMAAAAPTGSLHQLQQQQPYQVPPTRPPSATSRISPPPPEVPEKDSPAAVVKRALDAAASEELHGVVPPARPSSLVSRPPKPKPKPQRPVINTDNYNRESSRTFSPITPTASNTMTSTMAQPAPQSYPPPPPGPPSQANPQATFQHIQEMAQKRISTLDYLRKTHEGRVYWYNTLHFTRPDLLRLPSYTPNRLARRGTNLLLLGLSLPTIFDLNSTSPLDYLRTLDALLREFEKYSDLHPVDGNSKSSLSRGGAYRFFSGKSMGMGMGGGSQSSGGKGRRSSSAADIGAPMLPGQGSETSSIASGMTQSNGVSAPLGGLAGGGSMAFGNSEQELLPGEEYNHLITPSLPFDPDFFEVFATLCDVLIDTYMRICALISAPERVSPGVGELFAKADARLRKVIVSGVVKEFEEATKVGVKGEMRGVGRVVLGGLM